jgi:putative ABC transport system ATP-binding protein
MSFTHCTRCSGLVLAEDHTCRICNRPIEREELPVGATPMSATMAFSDAAFGVTAKAPVTPKAAPAPPPPAHSSAPPAPPAAPTSPPPSPTARVMAPSSRHGAGVAASAKQHRAAAKVSTGRPAIAVRGLTKVFGEGNTAVTAVQGVNFDVHNGEVVLIMGPSGSGKTTLLLMLGAMLRPSAGSVTIGGTELSATPERRLPKLRASHLGFVFQDFNLLSALNAAENVELACNLAGITGKEAAMRARTLLQRVGLGHRVSFRPDQLSGGEKQRVAVARALANDPPLLLADEPTANLDSTNGREIGELLRALADEDGRTSLIVTHDERLTKIADRVLWLEDGALHARENR